MQEKEERLQRISAVEFVNRIKEDCSVPDKSYALFIGAGCSVSSGIPDAASLVKEWVEKLYDLSNESEISFDDWIKKEFPGFNSKNATSYYGTLMKRRFHSQGDRQAEIERICSNKFPGFGYAVLSDLILNKNEKFNIVLTTNFDDLIDDSLYIYQGVRPLVISHESLASFIRPTRTRPLIVKLHGDYHLSPLNIPEEVKSIKEEYISQTKTLILDRGLIFIGYGGNDVGIKDMLENLPSNAIPFPIYWISQKEPDCILKEFLNKKNAIRVENADFDKLMVLVKDIFAIEHPNQNLWQEVFKKYFDVYNKLSDEIRTSTVKNEKENALKDAIERSDEDLPGPYQILLRAIREEKSDPHKADKTYLNGIAKYNNSIPLLGNYANFLKNIRKDYDRAEEYYQKALEADPQQAINLGNYAIFLADNRKDYDRAEEYYQKALEADPQNANNLGNYANFLKNIRKDYDRAEGYYQKALEADPQHANNLGNYAGFLLGMGEKEKGLEYLTKTFTLINKTEQDQEPLSLELWFYAYSHQIIKSINESLLEIKELIKKEVRSPGWDFSMNIKKAIEQNHPDNAWLQKLSDVINDITDRTILNSWEKWKKL